jgi:hypothetical protein
LLAIIKEPAARSTAEHPVASIPVRYPQLSDLIEKLVLCQILAQKLFFQLAIFLFRLCEIHR